MRHEGAPTQTGRDGSGPQGFASLHLWQIQPLRDVVVIGLVLYLFHLGYLMRLVTTPLLVGLLLAYLFEPIIHRLARRTGRAGAALIVLLVAYVAIGGPALLGTGVAAVQTVRLVGELQEEWPRVRDRLDKALEEFESRVARDRAAPLLDEPVPPPSAPAAPATPTGQAQPSQPPTGAAEGASTPASSARRAELVRLFDQIQTYVESNRAEIGKSLLGGGVAAFTIGLRVLQGVGFLAFNAFFLVPFFFFFCSVGLGKVQRFGVSVIPKANRERTLTIVRKMDTVISAFIRGRLTICAILAVLFTIAFWLARVPAPLLIGPVVGVLAFVPYLGLVGWIGAMIALAVTQIADPSPMAWWWVILGPTIAYWSCQSIDDYILTPTIQGKRTGLDTPVILVAVLGAASLAGVYGVLVALPAAACIKILVTDVFWPRYKQWAEGKVEDPLPIGKA